MLQSLLATAGLFAEPVNRPELERALVTEQRRVALLERHAQRVAVDAPAHAAPHHAAHARARARLDWLEHRAREEALLETWRRANPPTLLRELRAVLSYLGLGADPYPRLDPLTRAGRREDGPERRAA